MDNDPSNDYSHSFDFSSKNNQSSRRSMLKIDQSEFTPKPTMSLFKKTRYQNDSLKKHYPDGDLEDEEQKKRNALPETSFDCETPQFKRNMEQNIYKPPSTFKEIEK